MLFTNFAVLGAQFSAKENGLRIGQSVAHPSDPMTYELVAIHDDHAVVWIPGKPDSKRTLPLAGLFDPNEAQREAANIAMLETKAALDEALGEKNTTWN